MNENAREELSRLLDGDLSPEESDRLTRELDGNTSLREHFEGMKRIREAVALLAEQEEPPMALDSLVEPLRRARPRPVRVRPVFRWLAAAATLVLGVTVSVETARQYSSEEAAESVGRERTKSTSQSASKNGEREYFQLQPMPRFKEDEEAPLGALEQLEATPPAFPEVDDVVPLEVIGPLNNDPDASETETEDGATAADSEVQASSTESDSRAKIRAPVLEPGGRVDPQEESKPKTSRSAVRIPVQGTRGVLRLGDGREIRVSAQPRIDPGVYQIVVVVADRKIRSVKSVSSDPATTSTAMALLTEILVGIDLGFDPVEVEVEVTFVVDN